MAYVKNIEAEKGTAEWLRDFINLFNGGWDIYMPEALAYFKLTVSDYISLRHIATYLLLKTDATFIQESIKDFLIKYDFNVEDDDIGWKVIGRAV